MARDRDDGKKTDKEGHWWDRPAGVFLGLVRPRLERRIEQSLLGFMQKNQWVREMYMQHGKEITLDVLSALIGALPDPDTRHVRGKLLEALKDFAEIVPREMGRILQAGTDLHAGQISPGGGIGSSSVDPVVRFLEAELASRFAEFSRFFAGLPSDAHRDAVRRFILSRSTAEIAAFMALTVTERGRMVALLMPPSPVPPTPEEVAARRARFEARNARATEILNPLTGALRGITTRLNSNLPRPQRGRRIQ